MAQYHRASRVPIIQRASDLTELVILFEWDDVKKARQFAQSDDLRKAMQGAGVIGKPDIHFLAT
jgi:hypothetical protein